MSTQIKILSSLEKCFLDEKLEAKPALAGASALRGEDFHFTLAYTTETDGGWTLCRYGELICRSALDVSFERIEHVPVRIPCYPERNDDNYLRKTPGLYPDLLIPMEVGEAVQVIKGSLCSIYGTVHVPETTKAGDYGIEVGFKMENGEEITEKLSLRVVDAVLPEQKIAVTQWVHYDCIAGAHGLEIFSEEHWQAIENYLATAVAHGINTILTPVLTPPLDTAVGGERPTVQLVDIEKTESGYVFGFEKFRRFVALCEKLGVKTFEISHFFSQWGAYHAPKVMATVDGEYKRIFGWETDAAGEEYVSFLRALIPALLAEAKALGIEKRLMFHISDEPGVKHLEQYKLVKSNIADLLEGYPVYDALSDFDFYESGVVANPIPASDRIEPFLGANIENLWTYYCCGQWKDVSNRFIDMPLARTRIIGAQMWKYNIAGFLQWGYNFYYTRFSTREINPFVITDGDAFVPAGDTFSVYPAPGGKPYRSLRLVAFAEALADISALSLAEELCGKEAVLALVDAEGEVTFSAYPKSAEYLLALREKANAMIEEKVKKSAKKQRPASRDFEYWQIPAGATLKYAENARIRCTVYDKNKVKYKGEVLSMTAFAKAVSGKKSMNRGPEYIAKNFKYNGELIADIEKRLFPEE